MSRQFLKNGLTGVEGERKGERRADFGRLVDYQESQDSLTAFGVKGDSRLGGIDQPALVAFDKERATHLVGSEPEHIPATGLGEVLCVNQSRLPSNAVREEGILHAVKGDVDPEAFHLRGGLGSNGHVAPNKPIEFNLSPGRQVELR